MDSVGPTRKQSSDILELKPLCLHPVRKMIQILTLLLLLTLTFASFVNTEDHHGEICHLKTCMNKTLPAGSPVHVYCTNHHSLRINGRCCQKIKNTTEEDAGKFLASTAEEFVVQGLDLSSCEVTTITSDVSRLVELRVLVLDNNPIMCPSNKDLAGLRKLEYVSMPEYCSCPAGAEAWNSTRTGLNRTICETPNNLCKLLKLECPSNSDCLMDGPGLVNVVCLCSSGFYGYKCLKFGHFSPMYYSIGTVGVTVVLSVFVWITQRRKAKTL
ncbi:all-trans retinoic acid-induced differentiation factor-like [Tubulanus polymorphus]|uniref:all-trans retinoic acid-induced differentiation factor-like n=1 Tax=Tubulanus polymorphus TaxID=672921 RepID=UPI003DA263CE